MRMLLKRLPKTPEGFALLPSLFRYALFAVVIAVSSAAAQRFAVPPGEQGIVGMMRVVVTAPDETLLDIAVRHRVGQDELAMANPTVDPWVPGEGAKVTLPTAYILPRAPREGVVLNVSEMRLYYYPPHIEGLADVVHTYPVSIGRTDWKTPLGTTQIVRKTRNPTWRPPQSIIEEHASEGEVLPTVVPPGPDNPLGKFALRLALPGYLIHGTNKTYGIGMPTTHGCVRLYPEDIEELFTMVSVGTPVTIVDQPVKLGWFGDSLFIEVHPPLEENVSKGELREQALALVDAEHLANPLVIDWDAVLQAIEAQTGVPMEVGRAETKNSAAKR